MLERENDLMSCSLGYAFYTIGGKWKPYIIWYLNCSPENTCRYGELKRFIPWNISHKMFAQQLRELEKDGLITRQEYDGQTLRVEYSLTEKARYLVPVILYMRDWGAMFGEEFTINSMKRTKGNWKEKTIHYDYHPDDGSEKGVHIAFNTGLYENELENQQNDPSSSVIE